MKKRLSNSTSAPISLNPSRFGRSKGVYVPKTAGVRSRLREGVLRRLIYIAPVENLSRFTEIGSS